MMDRLVPIARQCLFFFNWCWTLGVDELDFCARIKELSENKSHFVGTAEVGPCNQQALRLYHAFVCFFPEKISSFPNFQERVVFTFKGDLMQAMKDASQTLAKVGPGFRKKRHPSGRFYQFSKAILWSALQKLPLEDQKRLKNPDSDLESDQIASVVHKSPCFQDNVFEEFKQLMKLRQGGLSRQSLELCV